MVQPKISGKLIAVLAVSFWITDCSKAKFNEGSASSSSSTASASSTSCGPTLATTSVPVKLLFVVDTSGSNSDGGTFDADSTDPAKSFRGGSIQQFFNDYAGNPFLSWGFLTFGADRALNLIGTGTNPIFTNHAADMQVAIGRFLNSVDAGDTPYALALTQALNAVLNDPNPTKQTKYIVVFLSDGIPDPAVADASLQQMVSGMVASRPNQVTVNTIYYGHDDPTASARLQMMATVGKGHFLDVNNSPLGKDFQIENLITVPGSNCNQN